MVEPANADAGRQAIQRGRAGHVRELARLQREVVGDHDGNGRHRRDVRYADDIFELRARDAQGHRQRRSLLGN